MVNYLFLYMHLVAKHRVFPLPKKLQLETHSEGIKIIPKTRKNSRGIPEMNEKVKLAIKSQQLARNMKKIGEKSKKN